MTLEGEFEDNNNSSHTSNKPPRIRNNKEDRHYITEWLNTFRQRMRLIWTDLKTLFTQPYLKYLGIMSFADFGLMASYYTLIMWFPEIFERFNSFETLHPNQSASVCTVSQQQPTNVSLSDEDDFLGVVCDPSINNRVFLDTVIIGLSCVPTSVSLSFFMNKIGKKFVLVIGLVLSGLATLSLNWVHNSTETLVLSCIFEALTSILEAVIFCIIVDLFPTNLRAVALAVTATSGRIGAILGNVAFGLLIDLQCSVPIYLFGSFLIASGVLCLGVPKSDKYHVLH